MFKVNVSSHQFFKCLIAIFFIYGFSTNRLYTQDFYYSQHGFCPSCKQEARFVAKNKWFRDHYACTFCQSRPRERALMHVLELLCPHYRQLSIHESSPHFRGASKMLKDTCPLYTFSYFRENIASGVYLADLNCLNQDLGKTSFANDTFDIVITQDVMEHVFDIENVFKEIARILKSDGLHIFTTPLVNKLNPTNIRATLEDGKIVYHYPKIYHGSPDGKGSLVTYDFGYDIAKYIPSNCSFMIFYIENPSLGLEKTEYNEVCIMKKIK